MSSDALQAFQRLIAIIPQWLADIDKIVKKDLSSESTFKQHGDQADRDTPSLSHPSGAVLSTPTQLTQSRTVLADVRKSSTPDLQAYNERSNLRKRKALSSGSREGVDTVQAKSRVRREIFYDGEGQRRFEALVRAVGMSRNVIRKGKMSATVEAFSRRDSISSDEHSISDDATLTVTGKTMLYSNAKSFASVIPSRRDCTIAFDQVDKHLEQGQLLIEKAAYTALRQGSAESELTSAIEHFNAARELAQGGLQQLEKQTERSARRLNDTKNSRQSRYGPVAPHSLSPTKPTGINAARLQVDLEVDDDVSDVDDVKLTFVTQRQFWTPKSRTGINPRTRIVTQ